MKVLTRASAQSFLAVASLLLGSVGVYAQRPESAAAEAAPDAASNATIRTNVPLVLVPVTVPDRKGKVIDGLQVEDFVLTVGGVPQKIQIGRAHG